MLAPQIEETIVSTLPELASGATDLPSQKEFLEQALPPIIETYSAYFDELESIFPGRDDHKYAAFTHLLGIDLTETYAQYVYALGGGDFIVINRLVLSPRLEIHDD